MKLIFWNCGVENTKGQSKRSSNEAAGFINQWLRSGVALVAVCEIGDSSFAALKQQLDREFGAMKCCGKAGKSRWDFGIFFREKSVSLLRGRPVTMTRVDSLRKAAHYFQVLTPDKKSRLFWLFLSHWPSKLLASGEECRRDAASALRKAYIKRIEDAIILMGDYNAEPFEDSMKILSASRDPDFVLKKRTQSIYNVTWGLCTPPRANPWESFGTFQGRSETLTNRVLLDQVLVSAHFLNRQNQQTPQARTLNLNSQIQDHSPLEVTL